jgi:nitrite reductase/ring-hydroxylating ferredoxin subunit
MNRISHRIKNRYIWLFLITLIFALLSIYIYIQVSPELSYSRLSKDCPRCLLKIKEYRKNLEIKNHGEQDYIVFRYLTAGNEYNREELLPEKMPYYLYDEPDIVDEVDSKVNSEDIIDGAYFSEKFMVFTIPDDEQKSLKFVAYVRNCPKTGSSEFIFTVQRKNNHEPKYVIIERKHQWVYDAQTGKALHSTDSLISLGIQQVNIVGVD